MKTTTHFSRGFGLNLRVLATMYRSPRYVILTLGAAFGYYLLFNYFVALDNRGMVIYSDPVYLVYLLAITAAVSLTITVYSLSLRLRSGVRASSPAGILASISAVVGGGVTGCACQAPILYNLLYFVGLNAFEASGIVSTLLSYDFEINVALILLNVLVAYLLLSKISRIGRPREIEGEKKAASPQPPTISSP